MPYPYELHFREGPRPQLNMGRRGSTKLRADGLPLWSRGVPRVSGVLSDLRVLLSSSPPSLSATLIYFARDFMPLVLIYAAVCRLRTRDESFIGALVTYAWVREP